MTLKAKVSSGSLKNKIVSLRISMDELFPLSVIIDNIPFEVFDVCAKTVNDKKIRKNKKSDFISLMSKYFMAQILKSLHYNGNE